MHRVWFSVSVLLHFRSGSAFEVTGGFSLSSHNGVDSRDTPQVSVDSVHTDESEPREPTEVNAPAEDVDMRIVEPDDDLTDINLSSDSSVLNAHPKGSATNVFEVESIVERDMMFVRSLVSFYGRIQHIGILAADAATLIIVLSGFLDLLNAIQAHMDEISRYEKATNILIQSTLQSLSSYISASPSVTIVQTHSLDVNLGNDQPRAISLLQYALGRGSAAIKRRSMHLKVNGSVSGLGNFFKTRSEEQSPSVEG